MTTGTAAALLASMLLLVSCGTEETVVLPEGPDYSGTERCRYVWRQNDGWAFLAWALDIDGGASVLAIQSGFDPSEIPQPGDTVTLPLHRDLSGALQRRLEAARLVREATGELERGDTLAVTGLLHEAILEDSTWSVPAYDLSLILLRSEGPASVMEVLAPIAHKYDAALLQSEMAWNRGDTDDALRQLEICLMDDAPPFEALAAAALIYTVTGNYYQASGIWREILASPEADASIRLMAAEYALLQEERVRRE